MTFFHQTMFKASKMTKRPPKTHNLGGLGPLTVKFIFLGVALKDKQNGRRKFFEVPRINFFFFEINWAFFSKGHNFCPLGRPVESELDLGVALSELSPSSIRFSI
jgi:hypothetical protein